MSIDFDCPRCGKDFHVPDEVAGQPCRCKQCQHEFTIPSAPPRPRPRARRVTISFDCPRCGRGFENVNAAMAGRLGRCNQCGLTFTIPDEGPPPPLEPQAPRRRRPQRERDHGEVTPPPRTSEPAASDVSFARAAAAAYEDDVLPALPRRAPEPVRYEVDDGEDVLPARAPVGSRPQSDRRRGGRSRTHHSGDAGDPPAWVFVVGLAIGILHAMWITRFFPFSVQPVGFVALAFGYTVLWIGSLTGLVVAGRESFVHFLLQFVPFYSIYYLITRWHVMWKSFVICLGGGVITAAAGALVGVMGAMDGGLAAAAAAGPPEAAAPDGLRALVFNPPPSPGLEARRQILRDAIAALRELAVLLDSVQDARSARRARPKFQALLARFNSIPVRRAPRVTPQEMAQLKREFEEPMRAAATEAVDALDRIRQRSPEKIDVPPIPRHPDGSIDVSEFFPER